MMGVTQYPEEWLYSPLENILISIVGGGTPSKANSDFFQGDIPWMSVKDMNKHVLTDTVDHISEEAIANSSTNVIPAGIPIVATRMSLGKIVVATFDSAINQDLKALFIPSQVNTGYFVYWYRSIAKHIESLGTGTTVKGIRLDDLRNLNFPLIPAAEQKEIADRLDKLLAQVEVTQTRLARIPDIIKQFSQSVLAAAVSGKLTKEWRKKNNANFTFHETKILNLIKKDKYSLAIGPFGSNLKTSDYKDKGVPLVFVREIRGDCFGDDKTKYIEEGKFNELKAHAITPGDILVTKMGSPPGDVTIYPEGRPDAVITADCIKISVDDTAYDKKYILFAMKSPLFKDRVVNISAGVAQQKVNLKRFRELSIPVPFIDEQTEIVRRVEQLFAYADSIEQQAKAAKERVDKLTQAILAKAFRGELTADWRAANPVLISGDNSAAALLARIQAERATVKPRKRASKSAISPTSSGVTQ